MVTSKIQFTVKIDQQVADRFKLLVLKQYGTTYGNISKCIEKALGDWIKKMKGVKK